jgi:hypothetical protein
VIDRLKSAAWGFGGMALALLLWLLVSTVYADHYLIQQIVAVINQSHQAQGPSK